MSELLRTACSRHLQLGIVAALSWACSEPADSAVAGFGPAFDTSESGWLLSGWASDEQEMFVVGGTEDEGRLFHFDGADWSQVELDHDVPLLTWAWGTSSQDVFLVGYDGTVLRGRLGSWQQLEAPTKQNLWGIWGANADDVWAVGGSGRADGDATLLHFDGVRWSAVSLPAIERPGVNALFKVWGTSAENVYAVGQNGVVLHYRGDEWTEEFVGASDDLISLWGTGPNNILAVGGRSRGVVSHFDGSAWTTRSLAPMPGLNGVWLDAQERAHVVGVTGTAAVLALPQLQVTASLSVDTALDLHAVFGNSNGRLLAVGGNFGGPVPPYQGIALERETD